MIPLSGAYTQNISDLVAQGDILFREGDYFSASRYYFQAVVQDSSRLKNISKYAESCRLFLSYEEAASAYRMLIRNDTKKKFPEAWFWLGMMEKNQANYTRAGEAFREYLNDNQDNKDLLSQRAKLETEACAWAPQALRDSLPVKITHLGNDLNTVYSDFGAVQMGDSLLLFSSLQLENEQEKDSMNPGTYLTRLYESRLTPAGPFLPQALPDKINDISTHNANICFSADHQTFFFTRCPDERTPDMKCTLFMVRWKNGKWQKPQPLSEEINLQGFTATQPAIAHGPKEDVLFFVSDRPGGYGGKDIWYSVVRKGKCLEPVNLGSTINTPGDEITPFYDNRTATLSFSSDWYKGFGGFDIFTARGNYHTWEKPVHLPYPLNTSYNDLYYTVNETDSNGYFTSNRPGSLFIKNQTCCNDLYRFTYQPPKVKSDSVPPTVVTIKKQIRELLPLTLYFHNDEPDPATTRETTRLNYRTTVAGYYLMKEKYREEYSRGLKGEAYEKAGNDIDAFFEDYVLKGMRQLDLFTSLLLKELESGHKVIITIKGFTSPLNTAEYNYSLAKRRISSLINYFREYEDGVFLPYLDPGDKSGGYLQFQEEPIGEEQASKLVSDNPQDLRNSVYSRAAALERRIQILYYNSF